MAQPWFDTIIPTTTIGANQELSVTLGARTLVYVTGASALQIYGIAGIGGNQDGQTVTILNVSNTAGVTFTFPHESTLTSSVLNRFRNHNASNITTGNGIGSASYRYDGSILRWIMMSHT